MPKFSPHAVIGEISIREITWTEGFWAERLDVCHRSMIPAMWKILSDDSLSHAFANFRIAAGLEDGSHSGPPFFDGDFYKWLESVASTYAATQDPALDSLMDHVIEVIIKAQREDGYIHTPIIIAEKNRARVAAGEDKDTAPAAMTDRLHFEVYNLGHLMTAACRHFEATGKKSLLNVAIKAADYLEKEFAVPDPQIAKNNICPSHYIGLIELFRITGDPRFRDLAATLVDVRNLILDGTDDNQDRIPFRQQRRAVGHAVRANYLYAGVADIYAETGDTTLLPALMSIWDNVAHTKTYITGATGALYDGVSPDGGEDHWSIQRVHQAYGREYQLPNTTAYNETCANIGNALWNWRMFRITGEAKYMDVVEIVLYNSLLSGISLDGTKYFYQNTLREERVMPVPLRWPRHRARYLSSFCCPPNVLRTIAGCSTMAYGIDEEGIRVNLYGGNRLSTTLKSGHPIVVRQESDYPWQGDISLTVEEAPKISFSISMRIPSWAKGATLSVESKGVCTSYPCTQGSYASITRSWKVGDRIRLFLPVKARILLAHPLVEENRNQGAVMRGPVVYCVESEDLPPGVSIRDILLHSDSVFEEEPGDGILAGIRLLRCTGSRLSRPAYETSLYSEISPYTFEPISLRLVPYYAWDNRSQGEMTVWLPLRWS